MMNLEYECATTNHPASRWKVIGCTILYNILGYMKSKNIDLVKKKIVYSTNIFALLLTLQKFTRFADVVTVLNFVAFLTSGTYPTFSERVFDLKLKSKSGPGGSTMQTAYHRELLFHLTMEILDSFQALSLKTTFASSTIRKLKKIWFRPTEDQLSNDNCVICKLPPMNAVKGGLDILLPSEQSSPSFCSCLYCFICFESNITPLLKESWDSTNCERCNLQFQLPNVNYM